MTGEPTTTIVGNLTADPELRFTPQGHAVVSFTVAATPRRYVDGEWRDGDPVFLRCNVWRQYAENVAESLIKGQQVVVVGRLVQRSWEQDGQKRTVVEVEADEVAVCLRFGTAAFTRGGSGNQRQSRQERPNPTRPAQQQGRRPGKADDPWDHGPWAVGPQSDEPPF